MLVCAVIPTFNRLSYLRILLEQLASQEKCEKFELITLVVVDGSTDGTIEMLKSDFPAVHVLQGPGNWWWTKSINEGIKHALKSFNPEYILILNDDSLLDKEYLNTLAKASDKADENAIIGSISVTDSKPHKVSFAGTKEINWISLKHTNYYKSFELLTNIPSSGLVPTYALNGRGTLVKSSVIEDLKFLNERLFPQYNSDDDLALRAWKNGYKVLIAYSCIIYDRTQDTSKGSAFRQDSIWVFLKSFFVWHSVNYLPKTISFLYKHGIKILLPYYIVKYVLGTSYAYFFKYRNIKI